MGLATLGSLDMESRILKTASDPGWAQQAVNDLDRTLCDHAHCEKKASVSADTGE